ncbi:hypothetical protein Lal_00023798 [Lupinus albus]|nr:hypothetical protein Lal_00023798 [Lupinus albus]
MKRSQKASKYIFNRSNSKNHSRAPSSSKAKWNKLKMMTFKINITVFKSLRRQNQHHYIHTIRLLKL